MRTIDTFRSRRVWRGPEFPQTTWFVRDKTRIYDKIVATLSAARRKRFKRYTPESHRNGTVKCVIRLAREVRGSVPLLRVLDVVCWYEEHCLEEYIPWIEGGPSLYEKFSRLEAQMRLRTQEKVAPTTDDVISGIFNGSKVLARSFRSDILVKAQALVRGNVDEAALAAKLGELYVAIRVARSGASVLGVPAPLELLERYVDWLSDKKDWQMTMRVLDTSSLAFQQFIREEALHHPRGLNPLIGRG